MGLEDKFRIDVAAGHKMAASIDREPKLCNVLDVRPKSVFGEADTSAINRFRNLVYVFRKAYKLRDNDIQLEGYKTQISKSQRFPSVDFDLCRHVFELLSARQDFGAFISGLKPNEFKNLFTDDNIESSVKSFNERSDLAFFKLTDKFVNKLMNWVAEGGGPGSDQYIARLLNLKRELTRERFLLDPVGISDDDWKLHTHRDPLLWSKLNYSAEHVMVNQVNCCITGPYGKHRDASILYCLDPNVFAWMFHPLGEGFSSLLDPFGLGIFVRVKGRHFSKKKNKDYLVFEGFPANQEHYWRLKNSGLSMPDLVYKCGLQLANELKISKMFINTCHSNHTQPSVDDTVSELIKMTGHQDAWTDKEGLIKDPLTKGDLASLEVGNKQFLYTHFLQKPRLDRYLVEKLRKQDNWSGESVFDTWYDWNKFIMDTYDSWPPEFKARHPYTKSVAKRGRDPQWNLGIGYCKGFEVDVEKECERLGIS